MFVCPSQSLWKVKPSLAGGRGDWTSTQHNGSSLIGANPCDAPTGAKIKSPTPARSVSPSQKLCV
jgi:hypothetical protein